MTITQDLQVLHQVSGFVELHILDATNIGGSLYRFSPNIWTDGSAIQWGGHVYNFIPIASSDWTLTSSGSLPQPTISVSNVNKVLLNAVVTLGDIVGAKYTRYRTFAKFLDGQPEASVTQFIGPDSYIVFQKVTHDKNQISWQLASPLDKPGIKLPARQVLKDAVSGNPGFPGVARYRGA